MVKLRNLSDSGSEKAAEREPADLKRKEQRAEKPRPAGLVVGGENFLGP
jgi:hypothetical protein